MNGRSTAEALINQQTSHLAAGSFSKDLATCIKWQTSLRKEIKDDFQVAYSAQILVIHVPS